MLEKNVVCQNSLSHIELDLAKSFVYKHFSFLCRFYSLSTSKFLYYIKILNNCFCLKYSIFFCSNHVWFCISFTKNIPSCRRGSMLSTAIFVYAATSPVNGYFGGSLYARQGGKSFSCFSIFIALLKGEVIFF